MTVRMPEVVFWNCWQESPIKGNHVQCEMKRGRMTIVSWIPEEFAKKGDFLKLKDDDRWSNGWEVTEVYGKKPSQEVIKNKNRYKFWKDATDI